jgi:hypothetical protein
MGKAKPALKLEPASAPVATPAMTAAGALFAVAARPPDQTKTAKYFR